MGIDLGSHDVTPRAKRTRYEAPGPVRESTLTEVLAATGRPPLGGAQTSFLADDQSASDTHLHYVGDLSLLRTPAVAIVGAREVTDDGAARARRLARVVAKAGVTVVSGLAKGVDVNAHRAAIEAGGSTAAVIGTPLSQAYPAAHGELQAEIARRFLLMSPFPEGSRVFPSNFPKRNRVMATLTDATVIIEASDTSGSLHQAVECERLGRWLILLQSVVDNPSISWPKRFASYARTRVIKAPEDVLAILAV